MESILTSKETVLIFAYAPAGLGHLRVSNALMHGLPEGAEPIFLQAKDKTVGRVHKIMSSRRFFRKLMEWSQKGVPETLVSNFYLKVLRNNTEVVEAQVETILEERSHPPKRVVLVATHFALAHQLAEVKAKLALKLGIKIILVVYVTDDSPQKVWYVPGADGIFVPSHKTKNALLAYGQELNLPAVPISVLPYPISPKLTANLASAEFEYRVAQVDPQMVTKTHICMPVSGAAVGMLFYEHLVTKLKRRTDRFRFHLVSQESAFTHAFLEKMRKKRHVEVHAERDSRAAVAQYNYLYRDQVMALEFTKPSEQAFKALLSPHFRGGVVLLFTEPVGRQEHDNLNFLIRHNLMPKLEVQQRLWEGKFDSVEEKELVRWRAMQLPGNSVDAAGFILMCLNKGILFKMMHSKVHPGQIYRHKAEMGGEGVKRFWEKVTQLLA